MSNFDVIFEALTRLNTADLLESELVERQIVKEDVIIHFTDTFKRLAKIIKDGKLTKGNNYTGVSFTQGFDEDSDIPLQIYRKDKWALGIQFKSDRYSTYKFHDANVRLSKDSKQQDGVSISRTDLLQVCDIAKLSNGDCWIKITARDLPIPISQEFYNYLMQYLNYQSDRFLRTHSRNAKSPFISDVLKNYDGDVVITEYKQYRTIKGNVGVYITGDPDFKIEGRRRSSTSNFMPSTTIGASEYLNTIDNLEDEIKNLKFIKDEVSEWLNNSFPNIVKRLQEIDTEDKSEKDIKELESYIDDSDKIYKILDSIDLLDDRNFPQHVDSEDTLFQFIFILSIINNKPDKNLLNRIDNLIHRKLTKIEELKDTYQTPHKLTNDVGGAPIYIPDRFVDELVNSVALDEKEVIVTGDVEFVSKDIDALYLPKIWKDQLYRHKYALNLEDLCKAIKNQVSITAAEVLYKIGSNGRLQSLDNQKKVPDAVNEIVSDIAYEIRQIFKMLDPNVPLIFYDKDQKINLK